MVEVIASFECTDILVGTIGMHLMDLVSDYVCSDENPNNLECYKKSVEQLPKNLKAKAQPYHMKGATEMVTHKA